MMLVLESPRTWGQQRSLDFQTLWNDLAGLVKQWFCSMRQIRVC